MTGVRDWRKSPPISLRRERRIVRNELEEQIVQKFFHRCPYCDQTISYDEIELKSGENEIECPSCKKIYIYIKGVSADSGE